MFFGLFVSFFSHNIGFPDCFIGFFPTKEEFKAKLFLLEQ